LNEDKKGFILQVEPEEGGAATESTLSRWRYGRAPPGYAEVAESAVDLGLAREHNIYPHFSRTEDCERAKGDRLAASCHRRFGDECVS